RPQDEGVHAVVEFFDAVAEAAAEHDIVGCAEAESVLAGNVEGLQPFVQAGGGPLDAVVIALQLEARSLRELSGPAAEDVAAIALDAIKKIIAEEIALKRDRIAVALPVGAETGLSRLPVVVGGAARGEAGLAHARAAPVAAIGRLVVDPAAVAQGADAIAVADLGAQQSSLGLAGMPGDDIDDAIESVGTVERAARPADHLDAVDILDHHLMLVPEYAGMQ